MSFFMKRASAYKSLFDPGTKLMRGKDSKGKWRSPFNPFCCLMQPAAVGIIPKVTHGNILGMCNTMWRV